MSPAKSWPRDAYADAVWASDLSTAQKAVALCYADHAKAGDVAWVEPARLQQRTSLGRTAVKDAVRHLVKSRWLKVHEPARQQRSARYRITVPQPVDNPSSVSAADPLDAASVSAADTLSAARVSGGGTRGSANGTRGSADDPDLSSTSHRDLREHARELAERLSTARPLADHSRDASVLADALDHYPADLVAAAVDRLIADGRTCTRGQLDVAIEAARRAGPTTPDHRPPPVRGCADCDAGWIPAADDAVRKCPTCWPDTRRRTA